jgi:membrane protease YdiL (CAAX protease family)
MHHKGNPLNKILNFLSKYISKFPLLFLAFSSLLFLITASFIYSISYENLLVVYDSLSFENRFRVFTTLLSNVFILSVLFFTLKKELGFKFNYLIPTKKLKTNSRVLTFLKTHSYLIGLLYITLVTLMCLVSRLFGDAQEINMNFNIGSVLLVVVLVPVVEELLFRGALTGLFYKISNSGWAAYFSVICFTALHGISSPSDIFSLNIGLFIGPMFLGAICEYLRFRGFSIIAAISFHAAANATIFLFFMLDSRWLNWLSVLYIS